MNILKKYSKQGIITTGTDNVQLDTPTFEIVSLYIDTVNQRLTVEVLHEVQQGSLTQKHSRSFDVEFSDLTATVRNTGKSFLQAVEAKILQLQQYTGATEV